MTEPESLLQIFNSKIRERVLNEVAKSAEPEDITELFEDKTIPFRKKIFHILRLTSLFKIHNGIFHKKRINYSSKISMVASSVLILLLSAFIFYKSDQFGEVLTINEITLSISEIKKYLDN
jgi:hypothetical protein